MLQLPPFTAVSCLMMVTPLARDVVQGANTLKKCKACQTLDVDEASNESCVSEAA